MFVAFLIGAAKVLAGAFVLFIAANALLKAWVVDHPRRWIISVGFLAFAVMVFYRVIGHDINVPANTVLFFVLSLGAMDVNFDPEIKGMITPWLKRAQAVAIAGGVLGWLAYARVVHL